MLSTILIIVLVLLLLGAFSGRRGDRLLEQVLQLVVRELAPVALLAR